jgi:hypothetical protein
LQRAAKDRYFYNPNLQRARDWRIMAPPQNWGKEVPFAYRPSAIRLILAQGFQACRRLQQRLLTTGLLPFIF